MQPMISHVLRHPRLQRPLRVAAWTTWITVAVLALTPDNDLWRPGATNEAASITVGCAALVTRLAFRHTKSRWQLAGFSIAAALLQVVRHGHPPMSGGGQEWIAGTVGALLGIGIARAVDHLSWRP